MRQLTGKDAVAIDCYDMLCNVVTKEYAKVLWEKIGEYIVTDVKTSSEYAETGLYNDTDIKYAIGRAMLHYLNLE